MEVRVRRAPGGATVWIQGPIRIDVAPRLRIELQNAALSADAQLIVDLSEVDYIDSAGLATLLECFKRLQRTGGGMRLVGVNNQIIEIFKVAKLEKIFAIEGGNGRSVQGEKS
ncbi:MAG: STAS domain-containing protein [Planctomycetes bacterium]|nr:STAS domain-containing protein [Planctomycetota bacterium]